MPSVLRVSLLSSLLVAALAPAALPAQLSCAAVNLLRDGGFEQAAGSPPVCPDWSGTSSLFGSPICSADWCGSVSGIGPRNGLYWTLFEGTDEAAGETASLTQQVELPIGTTVELDYFLRISAVAAPYSDVLEVRLDGVLLMAHPEPVIAESAYALHALTLDAWADGGPHLLTFEFTGASAGGFSAFNLDDVTLVLRQVPTLLAGSFEDAAGDPLDSPNWAETSTQYGSPLCTLAACGDGNGTVGPLTGDVWAWFGGVGGSSPETSSVSQTFRLPYAAFVDLDFQMGVGAVTAPFTDQLFVRIDGVEVASYLEPAVAETSYSPRSIIVDPYADGQPHTLEFEYVKAVDGGGANFSLDDVVLSQFACQAILLDGFETHDSSNWSLTFP